MAPPAKKQPKPVFKTEVPFTETKWWASFNACKPGRRLTESCRPEISSQDHDIILDLLCK
jgi:hypothetical protein